MRRRSSCELQRDRRDRHLVDAVELTNAHMDVLRAARSGGSCRRSPADRQLAVATVGEHGELHALGTARSRTGASIARAHRGVP